MANFDQATNLWLVSLMTSTALVKVAIFFVAWVVLWLPLAIPIAIFLKWHPDKPLAAEQKLPLLATLYLIAPLILWGASWVDGVSFSNYGLDWKFTVLKSLGMGLGLGVLSLIIVFLGQWRLGWIEWHLENLPQLTQIFLPILFLGLGIGAIEELIFRGFLLNTLAKDYSVWIAAAISSIIFAFCTPTSGLGATRDASSIARIMADGDGISTGTSGRWWESRFSLGTSHWLDLGLNLSGYGSTTFLYRSRSDLDDGFGEKTFSRCCGNFLFINDWYFPSVVLSEFLRLSHVGCLGVVDPPKPPFLGG